MLNRLQHSLSSRLLLLFLCAGAIVLLLVGSLLGKGFSQHFRSSMQPLTGHYIELIQRDLGTPPRLENALQITRDTPVDIHVFSDNGNWTTAPTQIDRATLPKESSESGAVSNRSYRIWRVGNQMILHTSEKNHDIYFQIHGAGVAEKPDGSDFGLFILLAILGVLILIYYATRLLFDPINDIEKGVRLFAAGDLEHKIPKRRNDQLGDLTDSINDMAGNISSMLEAKRQFLLGVSHELRSPLTRIKVNLALLDDGTTTQSINNDVGAMDSLIGELLESERLNSPHRVIQPEITAIGELVTELIENEFAEVQINTTIDRFNAEVDQARIRLLVRNLVQNAIKYNRENGEINISVTKNSPTFELCVRDQGQGVAREHIPLLTEPFYRADPSRRRLTGGYGLGLYLCSMIVRAHRGQLQIDSEPGAGTNICCTIPLSQSVGKKP